MARQTQEQSPERSLSFSSSKDSKPPPEHRHSDAVSLSSNEPQRRASMPLNEKRPNEILTDDSGTFYFQRNYSTRSERSSSRISETSEKRRQEMPNIFYHRDAHGKSVSPPVPAYFGNRDQRSSIRRFEMEQMEPRPLNNELDKESNCATDINRNKVKGANMESIDETSFRRNDSIRQSKRKTWYEYGNV